MKPYTPRSYCRISKRIYAYWLAAGPSGPREVFAKALRFFRKTYGVQDAIHFRDWMICLGSYPVKMRRHNVGT